MSSSHDLSVYSDSEFAEMMDIDSQHPSDQESAPLPSGPSARQQSRVLATTSALHRPQYNCPTSIDLMQSAEFSTQSFSERHPGYRRATAFNRDSQTLGHLGGHNNRHFDHWFDGEHPQEEEYMKIRDTRPAFLRTSLLALTDGERPWQEVQERWFPHIVANDTVSIMGMHPGHYLSGLYNLDGQIRTSVYIDNMAMMAGLRLAIGRLSDKVHIRADVLVADLPASQWDLSDAYAANLEARRFTVIPIHFTAHWTVGILDQATSTFYFFDSMKDDRSRKANIALHLIREILLQFGQDDWADNLVMCVMDIPQQEHGWNCGLIGLESIRVFFREHDLQRSDQERALNEGIDPLVMLHGWTHSSAYQGLAQVETFQAEITIINLWLGAIQRELGSPTDIRNPIIPGISFKMTDDGTGTDVPNKFWTDCQKSTTMPPKGNCSTTKGSQALITPISTSDIWLGDIVPGLSSFSSLVGSEGHHSPLTSEICIDWEQARNVELYQRMRRMRTRLHNRAKLLRGDPGTNLNYLCCHRNRLEHQKVPETDLEFLHHLIGALDQ